MTLSGSSLVGSTPKLGRVDNDFYATNPADTQEFLDQLKRDGFYLDGYSFLEPAAGMKHITNVLTDNFPNSSVTSTDLVERNVEDVMGGIDFLTADFSNYDIVFTNPPFKIAKEFIERALDIADDYVMMFAKIQLLEGVQRKEFFKDSPLKYVYVYSHRANPWRNGEATDPNGKKWASTMAFAWYVFEQGYTGEPVIRWI